MSAANFWSQLARYLRDIQTDRGMCAELSHVGTARQTSRRAVSGIQRCQTGRSRRTRRARRWCQCRAVPLHNHGWGWPCWQEQGAQPLTPTDIVHERPHAEGSRDVGQKAGTARGGSRQWLIGRIEAQTGSIPTCSAPRCTKAKNGPAARDRQRMHVIDGVQESTIAFTCDVQEQHSDSTLGFLGECW